MLARNQAHSAMPATTAIYTPLIDMTPSDPDTIMSAMLESQRLTNKCGQTITVFTNDQQLYRVAVNITWVYPQLFTKLCAQTRRIALPNEFCRSRGKSYEQHRIN